jgi:hypothetical protein
MCQVDFDWELGEALGGSRVYKSVKDLKANEPGHDQCGIVKVKVFMEKVVRKERRENAKKDTKAKSKARR